MVIRNLLHGTECPSPTSILTSPPRLPSQLIRTKLVGKLSEDKDQNHDCEILVLSQRHNGDPVTLSLLSDSNTTAGNLLGTRVA